MRVAIREENAAKRAAANALAVKAFGDCTPGEVWSGTMGDAHCWGYIINNDDGITRTGVISYIVYNGGMRAEWHRNDVLHRDAGPACIEYDRSGVVEQERWYRNGILHRDDGPAWIEYNDDGSHGYEQWYFHDKLHRDNGPAIRWYGYGQLWYEEWWRHGRQHRDDGPAAIWYDCDGRAKRDSRWYRHGRRIDPPPSHSRVKSARKR